MSQTRTWLSSDSLHLLISFDFRDFSVIIKDFKNKNKNINMYYDSLSGCFAFLGSMLPSQPSILLYHERVMRSLSPEVLGI